MSHTQVGNKPPYARKPRTDRPPALTTGQAPQYMNYLPRLSRITAPRTQIMGRTHAAQTSNRNRPCTPHVTAPQPTKTGPPPDVLPLRPTQTRPPPAPPVQSTSRIFCLDIIRNPDNNMGADYRQAPPKTPRAFFCFQGGGSFRGGGLLGVLLPLSGGWAF